MKQLCPVPTDSFYYFLEQYTRRHIKGIIPQHLLVLSDVRVTFHKNFADFPDKDEEQGFSIVGYAGSSLQQCKDDTAKGRCRTLDKSKPFRAPRECLQENRKEELGEAERTIEVASATMEREFVFGRLKSDLDVLEFSMRWESNGEEAAKGSVDWADLVEAFDSTEETEAASWLINERASGKGAPRKSNPRRMRQQIKVELKNAKDFNEEYVVFLTATVNFRSSIDVSGEPDYVKAPEARFFQKDSPGQVFRSGMVRFVPWQPDSPLMQDINDFDISLYFPDFDRAEGVNPLPALSKVRKTQYLYISLSLYIYI